MARFPIGLGAAMTVLLSLPALADPPTMSPSGLIVNDIHDATRLAEIGGSLQADLARLGFSGRVSACTRAVHLATNRPHGNDSFGAVCSLDHGIRHTQVMLCDDRIVGHFALTTTFAVTRDDVVRFTDSNCTGG